MVSIHNESPDTQFFRSDAPLFYVATTWPAVEHSATAQDKPCIDLNLVPLRWDFGLGGNLH